MSTLAEQYAKQYAACTIKPQGLEEVRSAARFISMAPYRARYETVSKATGVPWWVIGILHCMECGTDFRQHLHNGDPLTARTVQVPKGRPLKGKPPFTWEESAIDALQFDKFDKVTDWSPGNALVNFENYNGAGYRKRGVPSPYLWSYTDLYRCGKYTADGRYDPQAVSRQPGCAALMKELNII